jgi:hypothetical protein
MRILRGVRVVDPEVEGFLRRAAVLGVLATMTSREKGLLATAAALLALGLACLVGAWSTTMRARRRR